jgi:hypothetical protein
VHGGFVTTQEAPMINRLFHTRTAYLIALPWYLLLGTRRAEGFWIEPPPPFASRLRWLAWTLALRVVSS